MKQFLCDDHHPDSISFTEENALIDEAERLGHQWYYDLGDADGWSDPVNFLLIEDDPSGEPEEDFGSGDPDEYSEEEEEDQSVDLLINHYYGHGEFDNDYGHGE